jgi:hypothetical protein
MPRPPGSPSSAPRGVKGITQPRLFTPPLRPLSRATSRGYEISEFADLTGEPLLPWQRWLVIHAMELLPGGEYRFRVVLVLVARQNGKSSVKRTVSLWRLYMDNARLVLGCAQDVGLAREQWNYALQTIRGCPDLAAELGQVRNVNGDEWFRVTSGGRYKISASNDKAGRGLSVDELNIDELRTQTDWKAWSALSKTTMARARGQAWCMSNAGSDNSVVLNQLRDAAITGRDPSIGLFEWSAEDGCELGDWQQIRQANPSLGRIPGMARAIQTALGTDPPDVYRTEVLCQRVISLDSAIDQAAWRDCADHAGTMNALKGRIALCFDAAPDGQHATLAAAAQLPDNRIRVEIIQAWRTTDEARSDLDPLFDQIKPRVIAWYPAGPAAALGPVFRKRPRTIELAGLKVPEACQGLADLVRGRQVIHPDDPLLNAHIAGASKLTSGDGWRFTRRGGPQAGHVDAAYAAAGAIEAALTLPKPLRPGIRVLGA